MALTDNLIAYWPLNEASGNAIDAHTGGLDLTDTNTVTNAAGRVYATARLFTSTSSEYFTRTAGASLTMGTTTAAEQDFTVCGMCRFTALGGDEIIASQYDFGNNQRAWALYYQHAVTKFTFLISPIGGSGSTASVTATLPSPPAINTWYFVIAWHDAAANTINIQVNGGTVYSASYSGGVNGTSTAPFRIGSMSNSGAGANYFNGRIEHVGVWKRVLTTTERAQLRMHRTGGKYPFAAQPPTLLVVGDTQNLTRTAANSDAWGQWIADYRVAMNVKAVIHLGDHTEFGYDAAGAFARHRDSLDLFIGDVFTTLLPGNHDLTGDESGTDSPTRTVTEMSDSAALPMSLITGKSEFGQQMSATGYDQYCYTFFLDLGAAATDLFIVLPFAPTYTQLSWAMGRARAYPQKRAWIVVHDFSVQNDDLINSTGYANSYLASDPEPYHYPNTLWDDYYAKIPNLVGILCGHAFLTGGSADLRTGSQTLTGDYGNDVVAMVVNNQERNGVGGAGDGNGFTLICEMSANGATLTAEGYMPVTDIFPTTGSDDSFGETIASGPFATVGGGFHTPLTGIFSPLMQGV